MDANPDDDVYQHRYETCCQQSVGRTDCSKVHEEIAKKSRHFPVKS